MNSLHELFSIALDVFNLCLVYTSKDQEGNGGDIELAASKVKATSYYPGLYAAGAVSYTHLDVYKRQV